MRLHRIHPTAYGTSPRVRGGWEGSRYCATSQRIGITLIVNSLNKSIRAASEIVKQQQGDLLGLQEQNPQNGNANHTASVQIRVPQDRVDTTLEQLAQLGIVQSRTLSAEDVGDQLVDD